MFILPVKGPVKGRLSRTSFGLALLTLPLYALLFLVFMLWVVLLVLAGVNVERRLPRADARA